MMVMQAGLGMPPSEIVNYINAVIDIIVQLKRGERGARFVSEIYFKHKNHFDKLKSDGLYKQIDLEKELKPYLNEASEVMADFKNE